MHRDDSTSLDDVASTEGDVVSALEVKRHLDVADKPFFVNQDQEYLTMVHLSPHDDGNDGGPKETLDSCAVDHRFHFLHRLQFHRQSAPLDCVQSTDRQFRKQHRTYHIALAMATVSVDQEECALTDPKVSCCWHVLLEMLKRRHEDSSRYWRFVLMLGSKRLSECCDSYY